MLCFDGFNKETQPHISFPLCALHVIEEIETHKYDGLSTELLK
jgi:hypothetical protein